MTYRVKGLTLTSAKNQSLKLIIEIIWQEKLKRRQRKQQAQQQQQQHTNVY